MDEKTEALRDIFVDVAGETTVTERQEEPRGTLTGPDEGERGAGVRAVVAEMRERYTFESGLDDDALLRVVEGFFDGEGDAAIAEALSVPRRSVFLARCDLHLLRPGDTDPPFDRAAFEERLEAGAAVADVAAEFDVSESTVRRYRRTLAAARASSRASGRFRASFEDRFTDAATDQLTAGVRDDGLDDATEGTESESDLSM